MRNLTLILYLFAGIIFGYGNITENELLSRIGIFSIIPCILSYYLLENKKINLIYLVALISAYVGDITFGKKDINIDLISLAGFIIFNLLLVIIVSEKMQQIRLRKTLIITHLLAIALLSISYRIVETVDETFIAISIYFFSLSLLCSLCILYYTKAKSKSSLYFLIGVLSFIIASISKQFEYTKNTTYLIIIINAVAYLSTQYFYCKAILENSSEHINQKI